MNFLKKTVIVLAAIIVILMGIGFFLPSEFKVERSIVIEAPAKEVYTHIADLKQWKEWGVWFERDPQMTVVYSGPESAVGMTSSWQSEQEGSGEMKIIALTPDQNVTYSLYFPDFEMGSTGELKLAANGTSTTVTWMDYGDVGANPINHYFALIMDSMIGPDFEKGLANLKDRVEHSQQ